VWAYELFELGLFKGEKEIHFETTGYPWCLKLKADGASGTIVFQDAETLLIEVIGAEFRLKPLCPYAWKYRLSDNEWFFYNSDGRTSYHIRTDNKIKYLSENDLTDLKGSISVEGNHQYAAIRFSLVEKKWTEDLLSVKQALDLRKNELDHWMSLRPKVQEKYNKAADTAWFILWNCTASKEGGYTHTPVLMTKNWMNQMWAWDNCFNAMALVKANPELAWGQIRIFLDNQAETGILPDTINDLRADFNGFVKPPIYGLTVMQLVEKTGKDASMPYIKELYPKIAKLTEWWYNFRDNDKNGMCHYMFGFDSGADNATLFDQGYPTEGADLAAYLVIQMNALSLMASWLGNQAESEQWRIRADKQLEILLKRCIHNNRFFSPLEGKDSAEPTQSLINYMPVILGKRLPEPVLKAMVQDLSPGGMFLTGYGLASESPKSPKYTPDGYWRGPIWAPMILLICNGLIEAGEKDLAREIAKRFCDTCAKEPGMYENYDALTGKGLRAPSYSWTASCFLLLAEFLHNTDLN
jgi:glycogen debranching enzyme